MLPTSIVALFCEDIREEKGDILTLVGLLPDNVAIGKKDEKDSPDSLATGKVLTRLHIYIRTNFDPMEEFDRGEIHLVTPDGKRNSLGSIKVETIALAKKQAVEKGNPLAGIISRALIAGFTKKPVGRFDVEVTLGEKTYLGGSINFLEE